jgi:hypothetical protein
MNSKIIIPLILVAGVGYYYWMKKKKKSDDPKTMEEAVAVESGKAKVPFTKAFNMQYDVQVSPAQARKSIQEEGFKMQEERIARQNERMASKPSYYL